MTHRKPALLALLLLGCTRSATYAELVAKHCRQTGRSRDASSVTVVAISIGKTAAPMLIHSSRLELEWACAGGETLWREVDL